jgi:hypothetical protein
LHGVCPKVYNKSSFLIVINKYSADTHHAIFLESPVAGDINTVHSKVDRIAIEKIRQGRARLVISVKAILVEIFECVGISPNCVDHQDNARSHLNWAT